MPRDKERIAKLLHLIYRIWIKYPDLRLMQLLLNCYKSNPSCEALYNEEDNELYKRLAELYGDKL